ncbi:hypothetical protein COX68_03650 [Candidatus Falkowbacteria bacterium CG_4_10_14_0_2_um_filter_41_15]|uniref:UDP-glucose/GDP-mannose dehydrogenase N-terminal domain-containing protein n=2 Tax=Candidatus Falkowiibacteriota TaxID=1752728 RepID=A0A2G9ZNJ6_9BACT|nr:MAG: hypothetical protein COX21_01250 [Candidatus Falkowbacteria bacterium CG23_combo_of_CG06-09_8_20_14_all_41_10]PJA08904.1 MAG: hypothetical protein COX68_03650 [Candidatus Falkowbacteria bacterium CG_4_10_14_0_2_um_filter_41_15]
MPNLPLIGFIGQGFIGRNYADDFERRGFDVVRYSMDPEHRNNKDKIADCDIVFIAVPTPTTPSGFNSDIIKEVLALVSPGKSAVIKSTILPGTSEKLQNHYPDRFVFHSPEFLTEAKASFDAANPTLILSVIRLIMKNTKKEPKKFWMSCPAPHLTLYVNLRRRS